MAKKSSEKVKEEKTEEQVEVNAQEEKEQATTVQENTETDEEITSSEEATGEEKEKSELEKAEDKIRDLQEKYLRLSAEFDNYRKRTLKERTELFKSAGEETIGKVLPILDDLERALNSMEEAKDVEAVKSGISLIYNKLKDALAQQGLKEIPAQGEEFDTDKHEAVTKIPAPDKKLKGKIVDVIEKGYYLNDKVIRYSKVVIGE